MEKEKSSVEQSFEKCPRCGGNMIGSFCITCFDREIKESELLARRAEQLRKDVLPRLQIQYVRTMRKLFGIMIAIFVSGIVLGWFLALRGLL